MKQQASLFSFFGKGKKKRQASDIIDNGTGGRGYSSSPTLRSPPRRKIATLTNDETPMCNESIATAATLLDNDSDINGHDDTSVESSNQYEKISSAVSLRNDGVHAKKSALCSMTSVGITDHAAAVDMTTKKTVALAPDSPVTDTTNAIGIESSDSEEVIEEDSSDDDNEGDDSTIITASNDKTTKKNNANQIHNADGKSAYELLREKNIARNNARLEALGLLVNVDNSQHNGDVKKRQVKRKGQAKRKKASVVAVAALPTRRSRRLKKPVVTDGGVVLEVHHDDSAAESNNINACGEASREETEEQFAVSPLIEYQMNSNHHQQSSTISNDGGSNHEKNDVTRLMEDGGIGALVPSGPRLVPPSGLNAIYSLQWFHTPNCTNDNIYNGDNNGGNVGFRSSSWLVGAGKSGLVALWDASKTNTSSNDESSESQEHYVEPVISWKGHGGRWVADARFVPPPSSTLNDHSDALVPSRLLTAGNDGTVCHWDLTTTSLKTGAPKLLAQSNKVLHSSGIFSMDVHGNISSSGGNQGAYIVTGSKDKTLAITTLDRLNDAPLWRSDFHRAKVGSVSFSSSAHNPLIASASDDGVVAIHDARLDGTRGSNGDGRSVVAKLENAHSKPHSVVWKPESDSSFMTAGLDETIKLWDLRNASRPIASYHGHVPSNGSKRLKQIHRPAFFSTSSLKSSSLSLESFILSGGQGSRAISMFQIGAGKDVAVAGDSNRNDSDEILQSVLSRGKLPPDVGDIGSLTVSGRNVAVAVQGGEVLLLSPQT